MTNAYLYVILWLLCAVVTISYLGIVHHRSYHDDGDDMSRTNNMTTTTMTTTKETTSIAEEAIMTTTTISPSVILSSIRKFDNVFTSSEKDNLNNFNFSLSSEEDSDESIENRHDLTTISPSSQLTSRSSLETSTSIPPTVHTSREPDLITLPSSPLNIPENSHHHLSHHNLESTIPVRQSSSQLSISTIHPYLDLEHLQFNQEISIVKSSSSMAFRDDASFYEKLVSESKEKEKEKEEINEDGTTFLSNSIKNNRQIALYNRCSNGPVSVNRKHHIRAVNDDFYARKERRRNREHRRNNQNRHRDRLRELLEQRRVKRHRIHRQKHHSKTVMRIHKHMIMSSSGQPIETISIESLITGQFICLKQDGSTYLAWSGTSLSCMYRETRSDDQFWVFESVYRPDWALGFDESGRFIRQPIEQRRNVPKDVSTNLFSSLMSSSSNTSIDLTTTGTRRTMKPRKSSSKHPRKEIVPSNIVPIPMKSWSTCYHFKKYWVEKL